MAEQGSIRVGLIKAVPVKWEIEANWRLFESLALRAVNRGAELICTPECFLDGYVAPDRENWSEDKFRAIAQKVPDGLYIEKLRDFSRRNGVWVVFGFTELNEDGCSNAAILVDGSGDIRGIYRKTHLLDHDTVYRPGQDLPVWDTPFGKIGIMICADRRWPETARTLRVRGARLIMNPTYGMHHLDNEWWMRTRSYENEAYICFTHTEVALVTDPGGGIAAKLVSSLPDVLVHDIDISNLPDEMYRHRRPDVYEI